MIQRILIIISLIIPFHLGAQDFTIIVTDDTPCVGDTIRISHENSLNSDWTIPSAFETIGGATTNLSTLLVKCNEAGNFTISATESGNQGSVPISVSTVNAYFEAAPGILERNKIRLVSANQPEPYFLPLTFEWNYDDGSTEQESITATPEDGEYRSIKSHIYDLSAGDSVFNIALMVTNEEGCTDSYDTTITISQVINIPNVFTPNGDLKNDSFIVSTVDGTKISITIFSRWGNIVYESEKPSTVVEWNGRIRDNSYASSGVYYYVIVPENAPNMEKKTGFVHLFTNQNR